MYVHRHRLRVALYSATSPFAAPQTSRIIGLCTMHVLYVCGTCKPRAGLLVLPRVARAGAPPISICFVNARRYTCLLFRQRPDVITAARVVPYNGLSYPPAHSFQDTAHRRRSVQELTIKIICVYADHIHVIRRGRPCNMYDTMDPFPIAGSPDERCGSLRWICTAGCVHT